TRRAVSAKLSPPGGACPGSRRQAAAAAGHRCWISSRVKPSQSPKSVSRRSSSVAAVKPSSPAAIAAVATARCNGELTTASIGAPLARRPAAALACRVPLALSGRSRSPLKRCSGDSWVSPCRSRTVVVGSAVGLSQPRVIWLPPAMVTKWCDPMTGHDDATRTVQSAPCAVSAERDGSFPDSHGQCFAACGSYGGREGVMHPAGEHLDGDRLGLGWAYFLQVAVFDPAGQLGERRFQHIQIADHAPPVELFAVHHDLDPVVMIM